MLDMGFIPDIERIVKLLPFTRQTLFFSATMPPEITPARRPLPAQSGAGGSLEAGLDRRARSSQQLVPSGGKPDEKRATLRDLIDQAGRSHQRHHLLQPQARRGDPLPLARAARLFGRRAARRHGPACAAGDARQLPRRPASRCWWRATWRRAASTSRPSATSSISTCRRIRRTTSTASAAPAAPGAAALALTIVTQAETKYVQSIEKLTGKAIEWTEQPDGLAVSDDETPRAAANAAAGGRAAKAEAIGRRSAAASRAARAASASPPQRRGSEIRAWQRAEGRRSSARGPGTRRTDPRRAAPARANGRGPRRGRERSAPAAPTPA